MSLLQPRILRELELAKFGFEVLPTDHLFVPFPDGRNFVFWDTSRASMPWSSWLESLPRSPSPSDIWFSITVITAIYFAVVAERLNSPAHRTLLTPSRKTTRNPRAPPNGKLFVGDGET